MAKIKNYTKHSTAVASKSEDGIPAHSPAVPKVKPPLKHSYSDAKMGLGIPASAPAVAKVKKPINDSNAKSKSTGKSTNAAPPKKSNGGGFKSY